MVQQPNTPKYLPEREREREKKMYAYMKACILIIHNCQNLKTKYPLTSESTKCDVFT